MAIRADVRLPETASGPFHVADSKTGMALDVKLLGARDTPASIDGGHVVYRNALGEGRDVLHRVHAEGTEDWVRFSTKPRAEALTYEVALRGVAGLRLVLDAIEFLDDGGIPRLRMAAPYVIDATGERTAATVQVEGCAVDRNALAAPFGRPVVRPGAERCEVRVSWAASEYPIVIDPGWQTTGSLVQAECTWSGQAALANGGALGVVFGSSAHAEVFDGSSGTWSSVALPFACNGTVGCAFTGLTSGKALLVGGDKTAAHAWLFTTPAWSAINPPAEAHGGGLAAPLQGGTAVIAGGKNISGTTTTTTEIFDGTSSFTTSGAFPSATGGSPQTVTLTDGTVLTAAAGGARFFPAMGKWQPAPTVSLPVWTALSGGGALAAPWTGTAAQAQVFDASAGTWSIVAPPLFGNSDAAAVRTRGDVILFDGNGSGSKTQIYDPVANVWSNGPTMIAYRYGALGLTLTDGRVIAAGGSGFNVCNTSAEVLPAENGAPCTSPATCDSGSCVDGFCCDKPCGAACDVCAKSLGATSDGVCSPASATYAGNPSCAPYKCSGVDSSCGSSCATDANCDPSAYCRASDSTCQPDQNAGASCTSASQCASGNCVDGVCCDTACNTACHACSSLLKGGGADGTCGPALGGTDPHDRCPTDPGYPQSCKADGLCDGTGNCRQYAPANVSCGTTSCSSSTQVTGFLCNGGGVCQANMQSCGVYTCSGGACLTTCSADTDCADPTSYFCSPQNACTLRLPQGSQCSADDQCATKHCADGVCCDTACTNLCQACSAQKKGGGSDGQCGPVSAGSDPDNDCAADLASSCQRDGTCDGSGACRLYPSGTPCGATTCSGSKVTGNVCDGLGFCGSQPTGIDCAPYGCVAGACLQSCSVDADCADPTSAWCSVHACVPKLSQASACTADDQCATGHCADGVCCDSACGNVCEACTNAKKGGGVDGQCGPAAVGTDPHDDCTPDAPSTCGRDGSCDGVGQCRLYVAGTGCGSSTCSGNTVLGEVCNGMGVCGSTPSGIDCTPYVCASGTCLSSCATDADCSDPINDFCSPSSHQCVSKSTQGATCTGDDGCASGHCVDGFCCNSACSGTCQACSAAKKGTGADGECGPISTGTDPDDECAADPTTTCQRDGTCDGGGKCRLYASGTVCGSTSCNGNTVTGMLCDGNGFCATGGATKDCAPYLCANGACGGSCASDLQCAIGNICHADGTCSPPLPSGSACGIDHDCASMTCIDGRCCNTKCTGQCEACDVVGHEGSCTPVSGAPHGTREACSGAGPCAGTCDGADTTVCNYPGTNTACGSTCSGGAVTASFCDANGACKAKAPATCAPYACDAAGALCGTSCGKDSDCASGAKCNLTTGQCATSTASCKDPFTMVASDGTETSCFPYKCSAGACSKPCASSDDCAAGYTCSGGTCAKGAGGAGGGGAAAGAGGAIGASGASGSATGGSSTGGSTASGGHATAGSSSAGAGHGGGSGAPAAPAGAEGDSGSSGGCGCHAAGGGDPRGALAVLGVLAAFAARTRRARRRARVW